MSDSNLFKPISNLRLDLNPKRVGWVCLAALLLLYAGISWNSLFLMYDFHNFVNLAQQLPSDGWVHPVYAVGYRLGLRGLFELVGDYAIAGKLISLAGTGVALFSVWRIGARFLQNEWIGVATMLFTAMNRTFLLWGTTPNTDMIAWALALAGMYAVLSGEYDSAVLTWRNGLLTGALFGIGYLMRYSILVPAAVSGLWIALRLWRTTIWAVLNILTPYLLGFLMIVSVQAIPSMVLTGSSFPSGLPRIVWGEFQLERTGTSFTNFYLMPNAPSRMDELALWIESNLPQFFDYYWSHIVAGLFSSIYHVVGPLWLALFYPGVVLFLVRSSGAQRRGIVYTLFVLSAVVLFNGLTIFVDRYYILLVPFAILFSVTCWLFIGTTVVQWFERHGVSDPRLTKWIAGFAILLVIAEGVSDIRVLYNRELGNYFSRVLYGPLQQTFALPDVRGGSVFVPCSILYDIKSPIKTAFEEIVLPPRASISDLQAAMKQQGLNYVYVDQCSISSQPDLAPLLGSGKSPGELRPLFFYPEEHPVLAMYGLSSP